MLYEDDFEFEEQPSDVRDRTIGGKPGGGTRRRDTRRGSPPARPAAELPDEAKPAGELLREILERMGGGPTEIYYISRPEGEYLEVAGPRPRHADRAPRQHARSPQSRLQQRLQ